MTTFQLYLIKIKSNLADIGQLLNGHLAGVSVILEAGVVPVDELAGVEISRAATGEEKRTAGSKTVGTAAHNASLSVEAIILQKNKNFFVQQKTQCLILTPQHLPRINKCPAVHCRPHRRCSGSEWRRRWPAVRWASVDPRARPPERRAELRRRGGADAGASEEEKKCKQ